MKKSNILLTTFLCAIFFLLSSVTTQAQVFQQTFPTDDSTDPFEDYESSTPGQNQFDSIGTAGAATTISVTGGALQITRTTLTNTTGNVSRATDLIGSPLGVVTFKLDIAVSGNSAQQTTAATFFVGSGFAANNMAETSNDYARFGINLGAISGEFQLRDIANGVNSATFSGTQTVTLVLNNSGATSTYTTPDGSPQMIANDTFDLFIGTTQFRNDATVEDPTKDITDFKFIFTQGIGTITLDNIRVDNTTNPTAAKLETFTATSFAGGVQINWDTNFEIDNLGFNVYREQDEKRTLITRSLIAGSALITAQGNALTAGNSYSWFDSAGIAGTRYYLEDIDLNGTRTLHGFVIATDGGKKGKSIRSRRQNSRLLNALNSANNSTFATGSYLVEPSITIARSAARLVQQQQIAAGAAVKIAVRRAGVYQLSRAQLIAAGFDASVDASRLQLFAEGVEHAIRVSTNGNNNLGDAGIEFYGTGVDTPETDTRIYWLVAGNAQGKRINTSNGGGGNRRFTSRNAGRRATRGYTAIAERRDRTIYFSGLLNGDAENFFGSIFTNAGVTETIDAPNVDTNAVTSATLEIAVQGLTTGAHKAQVNFNGNNLGTVNFNGMNRSLARFTVPASSVRASGNDVRLTAVAEGNDVSLVDYIRLTYAHAYRADNNFARFTTSGGLSTRIAGFTNSNVRVLDISNPFAPVEIAASVFAEGNTFTISVNNSRGTRTLIAFANERVQQSASVTANEPSNLNEETTGADYVIITPRNFAAALAPLVALRNGQNLKVKVVNIEDIYDEWNYGARSAQSVRAFFQNAQTKWTMKPRFALLAGDASYDVRDYLNRPHKDLVPTKLYDSVYIETATDDWFVDFDEDNLPDVAIGRLPVQSIAELQKIVAKIVTYEQNGNAGNAARGILFVADRPGIDGYSFEQDARRVGSVLPANVTQRYITRSPDDSLKDQTRLTVKAAINDGFSLVNYIGHGAANKWTGAGLLLTDDVPNLTNGNSLSFFLMMTCFNGYFQNANGDSIGEALLKADGGAIASWASSGETVPTGQHLMNQRFYDLTLGANPLTIGEAAARAKAATFDTDVRRTWILLGDPATMIR